ncbi:Hypothetical predicted protein [Octopus vulgaris]|uniref:Uncharacterized protein n=1 Tax=Octopus vulgaris TaxID=6645 RepID=A0AA36FAC0_OCTVU|nr:Hypothetical predicted protein [Octopus vulgaris]
MLIRGGNGNKKLVFDAGTLRNTIFPPNDSDSLRVKTCSVSFLFSYLFHRSTKRTGDFSIPRSDFKG